MHGAAAKATAQRDEMRTYYAHNYY